MLRCSFMFYDGHHQRAVRGDKSPFCYFMQCNAKHLIQLFSTQKFGKRKIINSPSNAYVKEALASSYCKPLMKTFKLGISKNSMHKENWKKIVRSNFVRK